MFDKTSGNIICPFMLHRDTPYLTNWVGRNPLPFFLYNFRMQITQNRMTTTSKPSPTAVLKTMIMIVVGITTGSTSGVARVPFGWHSNCGSDCNKRPQFKSTPNGIPFKSRAGPVWTQFLKAVNISCVSDTEFVVRVPKNTTAPSTWSLQNVFTMAMEVEESPRQVFVKKWDDERSIFSNWLTLDCVSVSCKKNNEPNGQHENVSFAFYVRASLSKYMYTLI